jgi:hypothetical protein
MEGVAFSNPRRRQALPHEDELGGGSSLRC